MVICFEVKNKSDIALQGPALLDASAFMLDLRKLAFIEDEQTIDFFGSLHNHFN